MLVLTRNIGTALDIGDDIKITILGVNGRQVRVGVDAPKDVAIKRDDIINNQPKKAGK